MGFMRFGTGRDAADVAFATIFGDIRATAPVIHIRALEGVGLETPHHRRDAISTAEGCAGAQDVPGSVLETAHAVAPGVHFTKQLPD